MVERPQSSDPLDRLLAVAEEQLRWQRAAVLPQVRETIEHTLTTTQLRLVYELLDGERRNIEIAKSVQASEASVSRWIKGWRDLGIAFELATENGKRYAHLVSLQALGLPTDVDALPARDA